MELSLPILRDVEKHCHILNYNLDPLPLPEEERAGYYAQDDHSGDCQGYGKRKRRLLAEGLTTRPPKGAGG